MNVGSLFTGIGGFDRGLERAGMRVLWQCEADAYCRAVLRRHWPHVPCYEDVRHVGADSPWAELLAGGFPCQPVSDAGLKRGQDDERWLWPEFARVIGELRPRYVLVENVPGLLRRGMGDVLGDLAALGYDAEWDCLPAAAFGAPHLRDRVWLLAYPNGDRRDAEGQGEARDEGQALAPARALGQLGSDGGGRPDSGPRERGTRAVANTDGQRRQEQRRAESAPQEHATAECRGATADSTGVGCGQGWQRRPDPSGARQSEQPLQDADSGSVEPWRVGGRVAQAGGPEWWAVEPPVGRVAHGLPDRLDRLAALGNALVPEVAEWIGQRIMSYERSAA